MDQLPDDILLKIFNNLDNKSMWKAMRVSNRWTDIFASSQKLLGKFQLVITEKTLKIYKKYPKLEIKNVKIQIEKSTSAEFQKAIKIVKIYRKSIKNLEFKLTNFKSAVDLEILTELSNLESIMFRDCMLKPSDVTKLPQLPLLTCASFFNSNDEFFKIFEYQNSIEKLVVHRRPESVKLCHNFHKLTLTLPNLKEMKTLGFYSVFYYEYVKEPRAVEKLTAYMLSAGTEVNSRIPVRLERLKAMKGTLKELTIENLPADFDGDKLMKFIIEEMELETFYYWNEPLILNGKKQHVDGFSCRASEILSAFEMFRQFPTIRKLHFVVGIGSSDSEHYGPIIDPPTLLFQSVKHLIIADYSRDCRYLKNFKNFFKNFMNVEKLSIISHDKRLSTVISQFLPHMPHLRDFFLGSKVPNVKRCLEIVKKASPSLKKLTVAAEFMNDAKKILGKRTRIVKIKDIFFEGKEKRMRHKCLYNESMDF